MEVALNKLLTKSSHTTLCITCGAQEICLWIKNPSQNTCSFLYKRGTLQLNMFVNEYLFVSVHGYSLLQSSHFGRRHLSRHASQKIRQACERVWRQLPFIQREKQSVRMTGQPHLTPVHLGIPDATHYHNQHPARASLFDAGLQCCW